MWSRSGYSVVVGVVSRRKLRGGAINRVYMKRWLITLTVGIGFGVVSTVVGGVLERKVRGWAEGNRAVFGRYLELPGVPLVVFCTKRISQSRKEKGEE